MREIAYTVYRDGEIYNRTRFPLENMRRYFNGTLPGYERIRFEVVSELRVKVTTETGIVLELEFKDPFLFGLLVAEARAAGRVKE